VGLHGKSKNLSFSMGTSVWAAQHVPRSHAPTATQDTVALAWLQKSIKLRATASTLTLRSTWVLLVGLLNKQQPMALSILPCARAPALPEPAARRATAQKSPCSAKVAWVSRRYERGGKLLG